MNSSASRSHGYWDSVMVLHRASDMPMADFNLSVGGPESRESSGVRSSRLEGCDLCRSPECVVQLARSTVPQRRLLHFPHVRYEPTSKAFLIPANNTRIHDILGCILRDIVQWKLRAE